MKLNRIIGGILLSIIIGLFVVNKNYITDNIEEINLLDNVAAVDLENNTIEYEEETIDEDTRENEKVIKYTNTNKYPITITSNSISLECTGNSEDVELVKNNYSIKAYFSNTENGELVSSMDIKSYKSVYIHIIYDYNGDLPASDVVCNYNVNIISG